MLGLADALRPEVETAFLSFPEDGCCRAFLAEVGRRGFGAQMLRNDSPRVLAVVRELAGLLRQVGADVLCCHGYKADLLGGWAARRAMVPVVAVSRGWTGESRRVRFYEALDRWALRRADRVVGVSEGQAAKVRRAGVSAERLVVIRNAIRADRFAGPDPIAREELQAYFPKRRRRIVAAAGRLSPEKGFDVLVEAARRVAEVDPEVGFIHFGDGPQREPIVRQVEAAGLNGSFVLAGFRGDLDRLFPSFDLVVLPSWTEGLPNVALEALAAEVPVVATAVGGTPEVVGEGHGHLVPPGNPEMLALRIHEMLADEAERQAMGRRGRAFVTEHFAFEAQARDYLRLFEELTGAATCGTLAG